MPGPTELIIILIILLVVFGTKKLKDMVPDLGTTIKGFKNALSDEDKPNTDEAKNAAPDASEPSDLTPDAADKEKS